MEIDLSGSLYTGRLTVAGTIGTEIGQKKDSGAAYIVLLGLARPTDDFQLKQVRQELTLEDARDLAAALLVIISAVEKDLRR